MTNMQENLCDSKVELLIPWYVAGQLDGDDIALVETHISECASCNALVGEERKLMAAVKSNNDDIYQIPTNWENFKQQLAISDSHHNDAAEHEESETISPPLSNVIRFPLIQKAKKSITNPKTLGFIAMAQAAALVAVISVPNAPSIAPSDNIADTSAIIANTTEDNQDYGLLSSAKADKSKANVIMQLNPDMTIGALNTLLSAHNAQLVSGPNSANAYMVKITAGDFDATLSKLRGHKDVTLAEAINAE